MVRVKSTLFKYISGKSDGKVYRYMNGKTFYSIRPDTYNTSQSAKAKESRNNFALVVKFAKEVNKNPALKLVWSKAKIKGTTSYHRIIKHNIKYINANKLSSFNIITPEGEDFPLESFVVSDDSIILKISNDTRLQCSLYQFPFSLAAVMYLSEPKKKLIEDNFLTGFSTDFPEALDKDIGGFILIIPQNILSHFSEYKNCSMYLAAVFLPANTSSLKWTTTTSIQFNPSL